MKKYAYNPILPLDKYIPDGEPHVFDGRVYLFGSHDREGGNTFCELDYEFFSAPIDDLSNWSSNGINYCSKQDALYTNERPYMYAPDVVRGNDGKYYLYYCLAGEKGSGGYNGPVSVAVCDKPDGKYEYLGYVKNRDGTPFNKYVCFFLSIPLPLVVLSFLQLEYKILFNLLNSRTSNPNLLDSVSPTINAFLIFINSVVTLLFVL